MDSSDWGVRACDKAKAKDRMKTKHGKTMFCWEDGDRWVCNSLVYKEPPNVRMRGKGKHVAHSASQNRPAAEPKKETEKVETVGQERKREPKNRKATAEEKEENKQVVSISVAEGRKLCQKDGDWFVQVNSRPKFKNGGWEVTIKNKTGQKWSKASHATSKAGDGMA